MVRKAPFFRRENHPQGAEALLLPHNLASTGACVLHLLSQAGQVCEAPLPYCPAEMEQQRLDDEEMDLDM